MTKPIKKILIANRGEIAVRVMRACRDLGIKSVAVFSDADATAFHVRMADEAYCIGPAPSAQSYLVQDNIITAAKESGADAIHPGYGFLSENATFAKRCVDEGIIFIGPKPETIALLGDKVAARATAEKAGLPLIKGANIDVTNLTACKATAREIGYPILVKAAAGGGGKGMRVVDAEDQLEESLRAAASEAKSAFGDSRVYIEKYLKRPRHIEIQILCDQHGNCMHLMERECSIQRRHQKVIEESPSPIMTTELRAKMGQAAVKIAAESGYVGAGTVEFLVDEARNFYFLEVNTRLQVEHPVTELVIGVDLVREQISIAEGKKLTLNQDDIKPGRHAIECRIYAEDPNNGFVPSTGTLKTYVIPAGPGVRVDSGVVVGSEISVYYDPMMAKLITWGRDRSEAISRMKRALEEYRVSGVETTIPFHRAIMDHAGFVAGNLSTSFLAEEFPDNQYHQVKDSDLEIAAVVMAVDKFFRERRIVTDQPGDGGKESSNWKAFHRRDNVRSFGGSR
ncbi:MAG: acetyl-CoA carboxylase biotin carboxylase subunit [Candidatus Zixiibacteriota bacterium]